MHNIVGRFFPTAPHPLFFAALASPAASLLSTSPFRSPSSATRPDAPADFHFCRIFPGDTPAISLERHIHYLCAALALAPGATVLNIGSGNGDVAIELARFADVRVVGVEESLTKIQCATRKAQAAGLESRLTFFHASLEALPRAVLSATFDAVVAVESLRTSQRFDVAYRPLAQLLRPGGKLGVIEWCWSASFDAHNPEHQRLASLIEISANLAPRAPDGRSMRAACAALAGAGLRVLQSEDLAARGDQISWCATLQRALADDRAWWGNGEQASCAAFGDMSKSTAAVLVQAAQWQLFTPIALFVAQKPL